MSRAIVDIRVLAMMGHRELVIALRHKLSAQGLDAGPVTIAWHLNLRGMPVSSTSTIRRILTTARSITRMLAIRLHPLNPYRWR